MPVARGTLDAGTKIGRYVIQHPVGEGGMGTVYAALDPELGRKVALKVVRGFGDSDAQTRLLREAQAMARLQHPNVVTIHDVGTYGRGVFIAMELVDGVNLRTWLAQPRSWRDILTVFRDAGRGLAAAHAAGIIHRDFKLDNVLIDRHGRARVTDFGLARSFGEDVEHLEEAETAADSLSMPLTKTGAVVGTPAYMAPEQGSLSAPPDERTDEYSFCVSLYEALYGKRPFRGDDHKRTVVPPPPQGSNVPRWLFGVISRGLAVEPSARWPSIDALLVALARDRAARRRQLAIAGVALALAAVAAILLARRNVESPCDSDAAFGGAWNPTKRVALQARFLATGKPFASSAFAATADQLDRATAGWKSSYQRACRATRVEHTQSNDILHMRLVCLDRQRAALAAFSDVMATADAKIVEQSVVASGKLPLASECDDVRSLSLTVPPPTDPKVRDEIERYMVEIAAASARIAVRNPREAIDQLVRIAERAKTLGYRPLEAETLFLLGNAYAAQGVTKQAFDAHKAAALAAEAGRADRIAARAYMQMSFLAALSGRIEEARDDLARAKAALERIGGDPLLDADLEMQLGNIDAVAANVDDAAAHYERVIASRSRLLGRDHPETLLAHVNLGATLGDAARGDAAIEHDLAAVQGYDRTLGHEHPRLIVPLANLGTVYTRLGRLAEAEPILQRGVALAQATVGRRSYKTAMVMIALAELRIRQGRAHEAIELARDAAAYTKDASGEKADQYGLALAVEGTAWLAAGKPREADDRLTRGIAIRELTIADSPVLVPHLTASAEAKQALGDKAAARRLAERAVTLAARRALYPGEADHARAVLAQIR